MGQGPFEIERRYLVRVAEGLLSGLAEGWHLRQGYVKVGDPSVRIRTGEPRGAVLTCKSGRGVVRREVETLVPPAVAEALFEAAEGRVIEKVRHPMGRWELDRFTGSLEGLFLLEIELEAPDDPVPAHPKGVSIVREVTDDKVFTSSHLARMTEADKRALVRRVRREVEG